MLPAVWLRRQPSFTPVAHQQWPLTGGILFQYACLTCRNAQHQLAAWAHFIFENMSSTLFRRSFLLMSKGAGDTGRFRAFNYYR